MDFALTGEQDMLKALVARFASDRQTAPANGADSQTKLGTAPQNWALLADMGLLGLCLPEDFGGMGGGDVDIVTAMEEFGRGLVPEPVLDEIFLAARLLDLAGTDEQKHAWIPNIIAGQAHVALAHAEHGTRFDLANCTTRFHDGALSGDKTCVPGGADVLIVTAKAGNDLALFLVAGDAPGLSRRHYRLLDGAHACEIRFDAVTAQAMPGGLAVLQAAVQTARMAACAEMIGLMSLLLETTLDYVRQRRQFGAPIGSFQAIQHRLADLYASLELSRSHLYRCVLSPLLARPASIAAAKSYISVAAKHLGEECIQFHGGMGVSDELPIGHAHKRILVLASFFGDSDHELRQYNRLVAAA